MKVKALILFLAVAALLPLVSNAQLAYITNNGAITITGSDGTSTNVVIPASINGYPVTSIGDGAFEECTSLTSITIPNSITNIGNFVFEDCTSLTNISVLSGNLAYSSTNGVLFDSNKTVLVEFPAGLGGSYTIPNGVTNIGYLAFEDCTSLTSITIPNSVTSIGEWAFVDCGSLTNIVIGSGVSSIESDTFMGCTSLTSITIPNGVTNIGYEAFESCASLISVIIPNSVIGNAAFAYCPSLTSVVIGSGVTSIGNDAFYYCSSLTNVIIGSGVKSIGQYAFYSTSLTSVTIPNSVTSIGQYAFESCPNLTSITIPKSVISIGNDAFAACTSLTNISVVSGNLAYSSTNGVLFSSNKTVLVEFPAGLGGSYTIPNGVKRIGSDAFEDCILTSVTIPDSVTSIGDRAFAEFESASLTNVTFLGNAPSLGGGYVFLGALIGATVYYYYGTSGWGMTYGGLPTVMLGAPAPQVGHNGSINVQSDNFTFTVTGVSNQTVVVEASTNFVDWHPVWTNTLSGASATFTDSQWTNYPARFYRAR